MKESRLLGAVCACLLSLYATTINAAIVTFDEVFVGQTSFGFDGDGDAIDDVIFSTTDPAGFDTSGPGPFQNFISEPGLEGTSLLNTDLRVDFLNGASGSLRYGFALNSSISDPAFFARIEVFDINDILIGSASEIGIFTNVASSTTGQSSFPEGEISIVLSGIASYATFDFTSEFGRYIIDDFEGTFGSSETIVPIPSALWLFGSGLLGLVGIARRKKA